MYIVLLCTLYVYFVCIYAYMHIDMENTIYYFILLIYFQIVKPSMQYFWVEEYSTKPYL